MATADYSSFHQPSGTGADGTKLDNFIDAVQSTVNTLDTNNLTAAAGIKRAQLATGLNGPPGTELDYKEFTASVAVSGTSGAQTTVITGNAVTLDGATVVFVEFFAEAVLAGANDQVVFELYDGATDLGQFGIVSAATVAVEAPASLRRRLTPSNGSHTYTVKAYRTSVNGSVIAGAGGAAATPVPGFLRVVTT